MKTRRVRAELFHSNGQRIGRTDGQINRHDEDNIRYSQFSERA